MSRFKKICLTVLCVECLLIVAANIFLFGISQGDERLYRVEAKRVVSQLQDTTPEQLDLGKFRTIINVSEFDAKSNYQNDYLVEDVCGILYCIEYQNTSSHKEFFFMNLILFMGVVFSLGIFWYVEQKILKPFHNMSHYAMELAKGNLTVPLKEEKNKFFGKFLWGLDLLREELEARKEKELQLQKEKNTLVLSLSHDIKTPLSAIDLYAQALECNLYETEEKKQRAIRGIIHNTESIKTYVNQIVEASRKDFLNLEVTNGEFYLKDVMEEVQAYYSERTSVQHTTFQVEKYENCLLSGDLQRLVEVLQNIMENAMKYGDGERIDIYVSEEENCKLLTIENTGSVLREEEISHIFDSFYRGSNSDKVYGSGLGLYICKSLMRQMDGDVFAKYNNNLFSVTVVVKRA